MCFLLALEQDCYIHIYFQSRCKLYHLVLLYCVFDRLPHLSFILSSIRGPCYYEIPPLGIFARPSYSVRYSPSCVCMTFVGFLYRIHVTNSNSCCYIFSLSDQLATSVSVSCRVHIYVMSCWIFSPWRVEFMPLPLDCKIPLAGIEYGLPAASNKWKGYRLLSSAW